MNKWKLIMLVALAVLTMGVLAACGNAPNETENEEKETKNEANASEETSEETELSGPVSIDGSSTVLPIMEYVTYEYNQAHPEVEAVLNSSGSGGGFKNQLLEKLILVILLDQLKTKKRLKRKKMASHFMK